MDATHADAGYADAAYAGDTTDAILTERENGGRFYLERLEGVRTASSWDQLRFWLKLVPAAGEHSSGLEAPYEKLLPAPCWTGWATTQETVSNVEIPRRLRDDACIQLCAAVRYHERLEEEPEAALAALLSMFTVYHYLFILYPMLTIFLLLVINVVVVVHALAHSISGLD